MKVNSVTSVATAAVRDARDGPAFCDEVQQNSGLHLQVASGEEEAALSAQGVLLGWPRASGIVCDIGGASMELALVEEGRIGTCVTSNLGPLKLRDIAGGPKAVDAEIKSTIKRLAKLFPKRIPRLFLVGGSWRAIARIDMARRKHPLTVLHSYEMAPKAAVSTAKWIQKKTLEQLLETASASASRLSLLPEASRVLQYLIKSLGPDRITVSSYGLREGVLYGKMSDRLRALDPLLEACRHMEASRARFPGAGDQLFHWLLPLWPEASRTRLRLLRAACLLHDVSWRAHPDYRPEVSFEAATLANLGGVNHKERVALGVALRHRYKSSFLRPDHQPELSLLDEETYRNAVAMGRAIRLGATLTNDTPGVLAASSIRLEDDLIELTLDGPAMRLQGELVEKRLKELAGSFGCESRLRTTDT
jgi:exopolyphosphatase/guanosine-5'-triphosphate,3'-diphosphate pyrophosphatase